MIIDKEKKFVFVAIAKTACTSIHRRFGYVKDPVPELYHMHLKDILARHPEVKDYYKFAFVRNPYDRILSGYYNFRFSMEHRSWAYPIYEYDTFRDFIMNFETSECRNFIHLQPQFNFLEVDGKVGLDFIGRYENLDADFQLIESELGVSHIRLPITRTSKHPPYTVLYDSEMRKVVQRVFSADFKEFNYEK